jgi:hypothetical protein
MVERTHRIIKVCLVILALGVGYYFGSHQPLQAETDRPGAQPVMPAPMVRTTQGWHDIYLTYRRICRQCKMTDLGGERVLLENRKGIQATYYAHEVMGVDYHPLQRKFLEQVARNTVPDATKVVLPHYFPRDWTSEHAHYGGFYESP